MTKKPSFELSNKQKLKKVESELAKESLNNKVQTTVVLDAELLYSVKEVVINRKRKGIKPDSITGIIRKQLRDIVERELNT